MTAQDPAWPEPAPGWRHDAPDPPEAFPVPFNVFDALLLVLWAQLAQLLVAAPFQLAGVDLTQGLTVGLVIVLIQVVTFLGLTGWLRWRGALTWRLYGPVRPRWRHVAVGFGIGLSGFVIVTALVEMANRTFGPVAPPEQSLMQASRQGGLALLVATVSAVVLAPIVEELTYRGALFQSLRAKLGLFPAMFLSAGVFAVVHVELAQPLFLAGLFVLALWLAAAFHRTGSIVVPLVGHATFNAVSLSVALIAGRAA